MARSYTDKSMLAIIFAENYKAYWCIFIDIDEFIYTIDRFDTFLKGKAIKIFQRQLSTA